MLSIFIILIVAIALCAGIGFAILTLIKSGETSLGIQKNQVRLEVMASAIRARTVQADGKVLVPVQLDKDSSAVTTDFPEDLVPFTTTADGLPITYCVVGSLVERHEINGVERDYVVAGPTSVPAHADLFGKSIVAYLISPEPRSAETPVDCSAVEIVEHDRLILNGGIVTPVYAFAAPSTAGLAFTVREDPEEGGDPADDGDVELAAEQWVSSGSVELTINMPGIKSVREETMKKLAGAGRVLRINGSPSNPARIRVFSSTASGTLELAYHGDVFMKNVVFEGWSDPNDSGPSFDVVLVAEKPARLFLESVVSGGLRTEGGRIALYGPGSFVFPVYGSSDTPVIVNGGEVSLAARNDSVPGLYPSIDAPDASALIKVNGGVLLIEGKPSFRTGASTKLVDASGNARVAGSSGRPEAFVSRDGGAPATEAVSQFAVASEACDTGEGSCTAVCETGKTAVSGSCSSADGHALAGFGIDPSGSSFTCSWSAPIASLAPADPAATVVCQ